MFSWLLEQRKHPKNAEPSPRVISGYINGSAQKPATDPSVHLPLEAAVVTQKHPAPTKTEDPNPTTGLVAQTTIQETSTPKPAPDISSEHPNKDREPQTETSQELRIPINAQQRILEALTRFRREPQPAVGMATLELAPPRLRTADIVDVAAGGQRVTARIHEVGRTYSYSMRPDGTYRLEGAPTKQAPRLILDVDI